MSQDFNKTALALFTALLASMLSAELDGAPVTFSYRAIVDRIVNHESIDVGIDVELGDEISGEFTFEPVDADVQSIDRYTYDQPYASKLVIDGIALETQATQESIIIESRDNVLYTYDCIEPCPPTGPYDELHLFSYLAAPNGVAQLDIAPSSHFDIDLRGLSSELKPADYSSGLLDTSDRLTLNTLDGPDVPASVDLWNVLQYQRRLSLRLRNSAGQTLSVYATIGDFAVVPEPSSLLQIGGLAVAMGLAFRRRSATLATRYVATGQNATVH